MQQIVNKGVNIYRDGAWRLNPNIHIGLSIRFAGWTGGTLDLLLIRLRYDTMGYGGGWREHVIGIETPLGWASLTVETGVDKTLEEVPNEADGD